MTPSAYSLTAEASSAPSESLTSTARADSVPKSMPMVYLVTLLPPRLENQRVRSMVRFWRHYSMALAGASRQAQGPPQAHHSSRSCGLREEMR